jgi:hypothetical protein
LVFSEEKKALWELAWISVDVGVLGEFNSPKTLTHPLVHGDSQRLTKMGTARVFGFQFGYV